MVGTSCSDVLFEADLLRFLWLWGAGNWFLWDRFGLQWSSWLRARVTSEDTESSQGDSMGLQYNNPKNYWLQIIPSTAGIFLGRRSFVIFLFVSSYIFPHDFRTHLLYMYEHKILFLAFLLTTTCWPHQSGATSGVASTWILAWEAALFLGQQLNLSRCLIFFFVRLRKWGFEINEIKWLVVRNRGLQKILIINQNHPGLKRNWPMRWLS